MPDNQRYDKSDATEERGKCATCRYWNEHATLTDLQGKDRKVAGICGGIDSTWDWRLGEDEPREPAMLVDANALLLTRRDFGCQMWTEKEPVRPRRGGLLR